MSDLVLTPPAPVRLATTSGGEIGVHRIFCVGQNYADHVREMGGTVSADPPIFFMKPASALVPSGATIPFPPATDDLHHEAELVVVIGRGGAGIDAADAPAHIWGYAAGNDLTRRDLQAAAKGKGRPWDMAKGFDNSAVLGAATPRADAPGAETARILCTVDGATRQDGTISDMIWTVPQIIAHLSGLVTLETGDLIMTGTPAGVGPLARGQTCIVEIEGLEPASVTLT